MPQYYRRQFWALVLILIGSIALLVLSRSYVGGNFEEQLEATLGADAKHTTVNYQSMN